jgi:ribonuclease P protein component
MSAPGPAPASGTPAPVPQSQPPAPPLGHPRSARLLAPPQFQQVFGKGRRIVGRCFQLHLLPGGDGARLGLAVSRKVERRAVVRNRIRRIAREAFRHARAGLPAGDYVLVARRDAASATRAALRAEAATLLQRAASLKAAPAGGTMPAPAPPGAPPPVPPS